MDWAHDRSVGVTTDLTMLGSSLIKYGINDRIDIELGVTPLEILRVHGANINSRATSFGDTMVRAKYRLSRDDAPVQLTLDPFVKFPTANHELGNGKVEGGLTIPITVALGKSPVTLALALSDQCGSGRARVLAGWP